MSKNSNNWIEITCPETGETAEIPAGHAARLTGTHRSTAERWATGRLPEPVKRLLLMLVLGRLPDPAWARWRVLGGVLLDDYGNRYQPDQLAAAWLTWQQLSEARQRNAALAQQVAAMRLALLQRRDSTPWHRRQPPRPRQLTIFDHAQKSPA